MRAAPATTAYWDGDRLTVCGSIRSRARSSTPPASFDYETACRLRARRRRVRVQGLAAQTVLAAMAARMLDRPVRVTLSRQQLFALVGYRTPTIQRVRLGADPSGRLSALDHQVFEQTSTLYRVAGRTAHVYVSCTRHRTYVPAIGWSPWMCRRRRVRYALLVRRRGRSRWNQPWTS